MKIIEFLRRKMKEYDDTHNFTCDVCGREVFGGERVCLSCMETLPLNNKVYCPFCGRRVKEPGACVDCKKKPLGVAKARSALVHEGEAARLVLRFKNGAKYLYRAAVELMLPILKQEFPDADLLAYVPMTPKSERRRGYNQARLIAAELSERSGIPLYDGAVKRKETETQKSLTREEREKNLEHCFHISDRKGLRDKCVVIVDDILTTGATVSELAAAMKRAGAAKVYALTLTSAENKHPFGISDNKNNFIPPRI